MLVQNARPQSAAGTILVEASDGFPVPAHVFEPAGRTRATVVLTGGTAIRQSFYAPFASYLARHGLRTVTFDYRGIGEARPRSLRGFEARMKDWALLDTRAVVARFAPSLLVAHSFGGQLLGLMDDLHGVDGAVMVGVQLGATRHFPLLARARNGFLFRTVPVATAAYGYMPGSLGLGGVDLPSGVAREWAKWCLSPDYLLSHEEDAGGRFGRFDRPVLYYSFTDDDFAPRGAVGAYLDALGAAKVTHRRLAPEDAGGSIGHFGFFRPRFENTLWAESREYLLDLAAGRTPSARPCDPERLFELTERDILEDLERR